MKVPLDHFVKAAGNIEEWLLEVVRAMKVSLKSICERCAADIQTASTDIAKLRGFVDGFVPQWHQCYSGRQCYSGTSGPHNCGTVALWHWYHDKY